MTKRETRQRLDASATQRDLNFFRERERERQLAVEKTDRLRTLRLAKEASERAAAEAAAAAAPAKPKRKRAVKAPAKIADLAAAK